MKYQINRVNYHDFDTVEIGKLPPRSYFIPFSDQAAADKPSLKEKRYRSDKVRCLNGNWDFKFYPQPSLLPDVLDTDCVDFDVIDVPSCWQFRGYDRPFYVNIRYQFPYDPPHIPREEPVGRVFSWIGTDQGLKPRWITPKDVYNFVGVYRRDIQILDLNKRYILSFLGVASCVDVYLNGHFVGYSEGSHNTAEFDLTPYLHSGSNELLAVVHRWCTGTYLECQDMFRNNGIFRDVLVYEMEQNDIWDVGFFTSRDSCGYRAEVSVQTQGMCDIKVTLCGHGLHCEQTIHDCSGTGKVVFASLPVSEWSAETPVLYDLYVQTADTCIRQRVGFKSVRIMADVFTLNSQKLKFKGVNHHDTSCTNGYSLTVDELERDILTCKAYHIDTIRTSHYPPDPAFLELCDEYGIYVVDEADIETHGTFAHQLPPAYNSISHDGKWKYRYLDRVQRMYHRDKNRASIVMWSLGNEAGGYRNTDAMYHWLKSQTTIPVHYESVIHSRRIAYDVGSEMYPSVEKVALTGRHKRREKQLNDRPYFLCEYAHAMGVGPGGAEEYWEQIYQYDNLMGGCVWEMVDHAVLHQDGSYTYGGDHGEWEHDSNFCVDGLFYPDRTPSTGARLIRHIYRPLRVRRIGANQYEIFNTTAFTPSSLYRIEFRFDGGETVVPNITVAPMTKATVEVEGTGNSVMVVVLRDGRELSREQIILRNSIPEPVKTQPGIPRWIDFKDGRLILTKDGKKLVSSEPYTIVYRAPTDNDVNLAGFGTMRGHIGQKTQLIRAGLEGDAVVVSHRICCRGQEFICTDRFENCDRGILVTSRLSCKKGSGNLPRFGKAFRLDSSFDFVEYLGRNGESYCDMKSHTQIQQVSCRVADMTEPNIKPQESGNRCDCQWVRLTDGETVFTFTAVDQPFELGIKPYTDQALLSMRHREDEVRTGTYVTLSAFQMGIGTGSCGPATRKEYCYPAKAEYLLRFIIE